MSARSSSSGAGSSPRRDPAGEGGAGLDDEGVRRDVVGVAGQRRLEREAPVVERLPRRAVDEVEADLFEAGLAGPLDDRGDPQRVVGAVEGGEHVVDGRLHAEAHPGEAGLAQRLEVPQGHAVGVGLGGDLDPRGEPELRGNGGQDRRQVARPEQRRRTAAEEDGLHREVAVTEDPPGQPDLRDRGLGVRRSRGAGLVAELGGGVGVEVAVAAPDRAERHVHVDPERAGAQLGQRRLRQRPVGGAGSPGGSADGIRPSSHSGQE